MTLQRLYCLFIMEVSSRYVHIRDNREPGTALDCTADPQPADGSPTRPPDYAEVFTPATAITLAIRPGIGIIRASA